MKVKVIDGFYAFNCPACGEHRIPIEGTPEAHWTFSGDVDRPTFSPSINQTMTPQPPRPVKRCHFFIRDGRIDFCVDCTHRFAGQTLDLPDLAT